MKLISKLFYTLILAAVLVSCIEEFGGTGESFNRKEQIVGSWVVSSMIQRDLLTDNPDLATYDLTNVYAFTQYTLTLNEDGSFSTSNPGNAPEFVLSSGTWSFDDENFPSSIVLTSGANTSVLDLGSLNSLTDSNELQVTFTRKLKMPKDDKFEDVDAIGYEYTLSRN